MMRINYLKLAFRLSLLAVLSVTPGCSGQGTYSEEVSEVKKELQTVKEGQKAIQEELQEIKDLLKPRQVQAPAPAPREFVLDIGGNPFKGDGNAKLTLVEFTDYQ